MRCGQPLPQHEQLLGERHSVRSQVQRQHRLEHGAWLRLRERDRTQLLPKRRRHGRRAAAAAAAAAQERGEDCGGWPERHRGASELHLRPARTERVVECRDGDGERREGRGGRSVQRVEQQPRAALRRRGEQPQQPRVRRAEGCIESQQGHARQRRQSAHRLAAAAPAGPAAAVPLRQPCPDEGAAADGAQCVGEGEP